MKTTHRTTRFLRTVLTLLLAFTLNTTLAQTARIAFRASATVKGKTYWHVSSMNDDGTGVTQLTGASLSRPSTPVWSPGQQYIAFAHSNTVWVMEAKGELNGGRSFPVAATSSFGLDWSPDGTMICFKGPSSDGFHGGLYIVGVNAATGEVGTPALVRGTEIFWPAWSPDGSKLAFCDSDDDGITQVIKVMDLATGVEVASFGVGPAGSYNFSPKWKPDGTQIVFTGPVTTISTSRGGKQTSTTRMQVFVANADGTGIEQQTTNVGDTASPTWSPDGSAIAFATGGAIYKTVLGSGVSTFLRSGAQPDWAP